MTMKPNHCFRLTIAALMAAIPLAATAQTVFFSDTFGSGSTLTNVTPANPTANSTAYQFLTGGRTFPAWLNLSPNDLRIGTSAGSSVVAECQALFSTNPIVLAVTGDHIELTVTFTNVGMLTAGAAALSVGLYDSGSINGVVKPVPGGLNFALNLNSNTAPTGFAQNWKGYFGYTVTNGGTTGTTDLIYIRTAQTGAANNNQGVATTGTSSSPQNPGPTKLTTAISTSTPLLTLNTGAVYTVVLSITRNGVGSSAITNTLYSGPGTGGTPLVSYGAIATNATFQTSQFDSLAIGYRATTLSVTNDISSIQVSGSTTINTAPPTITQQPVGVTVASGGSCPFFVTAIGNNVVYQWCRHGTNLLNRGNISGANTSTLVITNAGAADALSGANGYYCVVSELGGASTNTVTNSLVLVSGNSLTWNGSGTLWDLTNSLSWDNSGNATNFNYGDAITFDDAGAGNANVTLNSPFLSASRWLVTGSTTYGFSGPGYFAGSGALVFNSSASGSIQFFNVTNTHTGGTIISNNNASLGIYCQNYQTLGNGPVVLAKTGVLEFATSGSALVGIPGDVLVNDDFTIQFDGGGAFAGVLLGNISGTALKTLTLVPLNVSVVNRYRVYGTNTVCNANIAINPSGNLTTNALYDGASFASYETSGSQIYNGVISGFGGFVNKNSGSAVTVLNTANTYSGGTTIAQGTLGLGDNAGLGVGQLNLAPDNGSTTGSGTILAYGGARVIANVIAYPSGTNNFTLVVGGTNDLAFTKGLDLNGVDNQGNPGSRTIQINNTAATTMAGAIVDSSANSLGLVKTGTGTLYLNNANSFGGITTNSAGVLAGTGSLAGSVDAKSGASMGGGSAAAIGTLTVGGSLTFENGGGGYFRLNSANGQTSDRVAVTGLITNFSTGTNIVVTNLGPTLVIGNSFTLFNKGVTNGSTWTITGGVPAGLGWTNNLALNGTIQVVQSFATYPTNINFSVNGSTLNISWPGTHQGWSLQAQTNTLNKGLGTNWVSIPGTSSVISTNLTIVPGSPTVFYRLKMP